MIEFPGIVPALAQALSKRGYNELTPVQQAVLAPEHRGADALVSAQTGSGKTVAFGLTLAPTLLDDEDQFSHPEAPLALAVAPTRELALQVMRELEWLYESTGAKVVSCVGGMDMRTERRVLQRGAHIVVGTPGRLRDHIQRTSLDLSQLRAVVLDEADEMLDLGFRDDLEFILGAAPENRRTLMFSATVPRAIANLAKSYQRNAVRIVTEEELKQHLDIEYRAIISANAEREAAIINVLRYYEAKNALVFCNTRAAVNRVTARFNNRGFSVVALSGEFSQNERTHALQAMRDGRARVCIATDVAARGIDLPNLDLVIHADLPTNRETLLHRSGRTGRAGRKGVSVLIVPHKERKRAERLLRAATINATWAQPPSIEEILQRDDQRLLADPVLNEPITESEQALAQTLLTQHSPEQVAGAFVRLFRVGQSAPEELLNAAPRDRKKKRRGDFGDSTWFSVSVGLKHGAEPRWLLPLLCGAGGITNREIGAIEIQEVETYVQMASDSADSFVAALGPSQTLEKQITATRLDGTPEFTSSTNDKPSGRQKSRSEQASPSARSSGPSRKKKSKRSSSAVQPSADDGGSGKVRKKRKPSKNKGKPKFAKQGTEASGQDKPGGGQKARKRPRSQSQNKAR